MLLKLIILSHFCTPCIRILTANLYLVQQSLNVSRDGIDWRTFNSALRASIILVQAICYAVSAEQLLAFPARFRVSYQVGAQAAFEGIQEPLDLGLIRYPLWWEVDTTFLMIRAPILLLCITEMRWLSLRQLVITNTAGGQEQVGLLPQVFGQGAVKLVLLKVI